MFVCGLSAVVFEDNYFGKSLLINFSNTCNSLSSKAINSSQAKSLKTDEAVEVFNVTENKINSITDFFYLKHYLDLWLLQLQSREIFSENFLEFFAKPSERLVQKKEAFTHIQRALYITTLYSRKSLECQFTDLLELHFYLQPIKKLKQSPRKSLICETISKQFARANKRQKLSYPLGEQAETFFLHRKPKTNAHFWTYQFKSTHYILQVSL